MAPGNLKDVLLQTARNDFPFFYARANARETKLMDMLVLLTALFLRLQKEPAEAEAPGAYPEEKRAEVTRVFVQLRDELKRLPTFGALPNLERQTIERVLFGRVP